MSRASDLTPLLAPAPAPTVGLRQGTVLSYDPSDGSNTISVAGAVLTDLPLLNIGDTTNLAVGDVVVIVRYGSSWAILGRLIVPGGAALNTTAVDFGSLGETASNFAVSTSYTTKVSGTITAPAWANRVLVHASADATVENTSASLDLLTGRIVIDGAAGGTNYASVGTAAGEFADRYASIACSAVREVPVTGGQVIDVEFDIQTSTANWTADTGNIANLNATAVFIRRI